LRTCTRARPRPSEGRVVALTGRVRGVKLSRSGETAGLEIVSSPLLLDLWEINILLFHKECFSRPHFATTNSKRSIQSLAPLYSSPGTRSGSLTELQIAGRHGRVEPRLRRQRLSAISFVLGMKSWNVDPSGTGVRDVGTTDALFTSPNLFLALIRRGGKRPRN